MTRASTTITRFYVQRRLREDWHVERLANPERMLCGVVIAVDEGIVTTSRPRRVCASCAERMT